MGNSSRKYLSFYRIFNWYAYYNFFCKAVVRMSAGLRNKP